jgi:acyl carrier protein
MLVNPFTVRKNIAELISTKKGIRKSRLLKHVTFNQFGFDTLDLVDLILEVEKVYNVIIPDEIPLNNIDDFVDFICGRRLQQAS